jgi:macrolide transport system ATP-binding/permease protein
MIASHLRGMAGVELGRAMTVVNLLGSPPERILSSTSLSPGETRKVLLAVGISHVPYLIIMDEPTNHLDLPSIECLTDALRACQCGLLLASHDERFLTALTNTRWDIEVRKGVNFLRTS